MKKLLAVVAVSAAALLSAQVQAKDIDLVSGAQALQDKIDAAAAKAENAKAKAAAKKKAVEDAGKNLKNSLGNLQKAIAE